MLRRKSAIYARQYRRPVILGNLTYTLLIGGIKDGDNAGKTGC
jgi:hypothetical protein